MDDVSPMQPIWQLYDLQNEFIRALGKRSWTKNFKEQMKTKMRTFSGLLHKVRTCCSGYTGGEDVLEAIEAIQTDVKRRMGEL